MKGSRFLFLVLTVAAADILVPYLWLADRPGFAASYLFWCLITLAVIVGAGIHIRNWGKKQ